MHLSLQKTVLLSFHVWMGLGGDKDGEVLAFVLFVEFCSPFVFSARALKMIMKIRLSVLFESFRVFICASCRRT
jgi:hypothetical protein